MLDVRGTLAIENEEKVIYVKCHLGQQLVSVARTLPWQCNHKGHPITISIRLVLTSNKYAKLNERSLEVSNGLFLD